MDDAPVPQVWRAWAVRVDARDACRLCKPEPITDRDSLPMPVCFEHFFRWLHLIEQRGWPAYQSGSRVLYCVHPATVPV